MLRTRFFLSALPLVAAATLFWATGIADAGPHGGGHSGSGHGGGGGRAAPAHTSGAHWSGSPAGAHWGGSPGWNAGTANWNGHPNGNWNNVHNNANWNNFHNNNFNNRNFHRFPYFYAFYPSLFFGLGYYPGFYDYYGYYDYPYYYGSGYPYYGSGYSDYSYAPDYNYAPSPYAVPGNGSQAAPSPQDTAVSMMVRVPDPNADVWVDGVKTTQKGTARPFVSPSLRSGKEYTYEIRARWMENGQEVTQTRQVPFHAGDRLTVAFQQPAAQPSQTTTSTPNSP